MEIILTKDKIGNRYKLIDLGSRSVKKIEIDSVKKFPLFEHDWSLEPKKDHLIHASLEILGINLNF